VQNGCAHNDDLIGLHALATGRVERNRRCRARPHG